MIRVAIVAFMLLGALATDASACHRCGLFGRRCRFQHHVAHHVPYVPPAAYVPPAQQTNFIFNNSSVPAYLLSPQGNSVYGYQVSAQSYNLDPALYMDRSGRLAEQAMALAQEGQNGYNAGVALAMQFNESLDRRQKNTVLALSAMEANKTTSQASSFRATVEGGKLSVEQYPNGLPPQQQVGGLLTTKCAACHSGGTAKAGLVLDGSQEVSDRSVRRINEIFGLKRNVPKEMQQLVDGLSPKEKGQLLEEFLKLPAEGTSTTLPPRPDDGLQ